jgi:hypothetical protein
MGSIPFRVIISGTDTTAFSKVNKDQEVQEAEEHVVEAKVKMMNAEAEKLGISARYAIPA